MLATAQNSFLDSMERALLPGPGLIDSRTEKDWLCFLTDFASLINFYDNSNMIRGNWTPFLAKDPVFLLAAISKTPFEKFYSAYTNVCVQLENSLQPGESPDNLSRGFNQMFDHLTGIFMHIKRWIYYMKVSVYEYPLKTYVIQQVKTTFSRYFWALISLRQNLFLSGAIGGIEPVDHSQLIFFESHDELIWKQNKDKSPYWDILGLSYPIKSEQNTPSRFYDVVTKAGNELFIFFNNIITQATAEYEILKTQKSKYPDTLLLRTFVDLLKVHQEQLNGITQKHLQFYYEDILKQEKLPAVADSVFICAELAKKDAVFNLPAGTLFDAGADTENKPVVFASQENVSLNPATITGAYTLATVKDPVDERYRLYLQTITGTDTVHKDENGKTTTWETFGTANGTEIIKVSPAIAFGSPLLLLREGHRWITCTLEFKTPIDQDKLFKDAKYYLSTQTGWLPVEPQPANPGNPSGNNNQAVLLFELPPATPPIEAFLKNPDGLNSTWPMLKIELGSVTDFSTPEELSALRIEVKVTGVKTFQLYNDYGMVSPQAPFPLFGPAPLLNSNFIIGSNEIFSKPVHSLNIKLEWDKLPEFLQYYLQYNEYIRWQQLLQEEAKKSWLRRTLDSLLKPILQAWNWVKNLCQEKAEFVFKNQFNNTCFKADFKVLQDHSWQDFPVRMKTPVVIESNLPHEHPAAGESNVAVDLQPVNLLFRTEGEDRHLSTWSCFAYEQTKAGDPVFPFDPALQLLPLQFTKDSVSGFMKMTLAAPDFGFGSGIYPNVVSYIALKNAQEMTKMIADDDYKPKFTEPANLPFVPKLTNLTGHYTASQQYFFTAKDDYPLQCFLYTPFGNYMVYDKMSVSNDYSYTINKPAVQQTTVPLFHSFTYGGYLFLEMENVIAPGVIHLYFELMRKYVANTAAKNTEYFYLSTAGWKELPVLSDGTGQFSGSGVIKLKVPADIDRAGKAMQADGKYWIAITAKGDPASFANTIFLKTNGIETIRTGDTFFYDTTVPRLAAGTIKKTQNVMPRIATIVQPFPSFGGKAAEDQVMMYRRVSNRIKTKDRVVAAEDYYRLIRQEFDDVYYSKTVFDENKKYTGVYVVKAVQGVTEPDAFIPLLSEYKEKAIQDFLTERAPVFYNIRVSSFNLQLVQVHAEVSVKPGFENHAIQIDIVNALNFFLSPWISGSGIQTIIDTDISDDQVAALIGSIEGVKGVGAISFRSCEYKGGDFTMPEGLPVITKVTPIGDNYLMISGMNHSIQFVT